ncbi:hypothetical protein GCM10010302_09720 [Streptomyces polychromogenes]|uniref:Uncharacterized protein n=1 Tax=Streptomyces polychromogenes TaxID=67342 RepID=A0ABP3ER53_9ACTN
MQMLNVSEKVFRRRASQSMTSASLKTAVVTPPGITSTSKGGSSSRMWSATIRSPPRARTGRLVAATVSTRSSRGSSETSMPNVSGAPGAETPGAHRVVGGLDIVVHHGLGRLRHADAGTVPGGIHLQRRVRPGRRGPAGREGGDDALAARPSASRNAIRR